MFVKKSHHTRHARARDDIIEFYRAAAQNEGRAPRVLSRGALPDLRVKKSGACAPDDVSVLLHLVEPFCKTALFVGGGVLFENALGYGAVYYRAGLGEHGGGGRFVAAFNDRKEFLHCVFYLSFDNSVPHCLLFGYENALFR